MADDKKDNDRAVAPSSAGPCTALVKAPRRLRELERIPVRRRPRLLGDALTEEEIDRRWRALHGRPALQEGNRR